MGWLQSVSSKLGLSLNAASELNDAYDAILVAEASMRDAIAKMTEAKVQIAQAVSAIKAIKQPN